MGTKENREITTVAKVSKENINTKEWVEKVFQVQRANDSEMEKEKNAEKSPDSVSAEEKRRRQRSLLIRHAGKEWRKQRALMRMGYCIVCR